MSKSLQITLYISEESVLRCHTIDLPVSSITSLRAILEHISSLHLHQPGRFLKRMNLALGHCQASDEEGILRLLRAAQTELRPPYLRAMVFTASENSLIFEAVIEDPINIARLFQGDSTISGAFSAHSTANSGNISAISPNPAATGPQWNGGPSNGA